MLYPTTVHLAQAKIQRFANGAHVEWCKVKQAVPTPNTGDFKKTPYLSNTAGYDAIESFEVADGQVVNYIRWEVVL